MYNWSCRDEVKLIGCFVSFPFSLLQFLSVFLYLSLVAREYPILDVLSFTWVFFFLFFSFKL